MLLTGESPEIMRRGAVVFDDITLFDDIVDPGAGVAEAQRPAYRAAYLSVRPSLFRGGNANRATPGHGSPRRPSVPRSIATVFGCR